MGYKVRATNLQNVAPGNTATLKIASGKGGATLDKIRLKISGTAATAAHIERIRGKANGRIFLDEGGGSLVNKRDDYRGVFNSTDYVVIDFTEPKARNGAVEQLLASVPLSLLQDCSFEIDIAAGAPSDIAIKAEIEVRRPTQNPFILKKLQTSQAFAASGEQIIYLPTGGAGGKMKRVWIHENTPGTITDAQIRVGNSVAWETTRANLEHSQKENGLTPQAGIMVLDFIEDGNLSGVLDTGNAPNTELRLQSTAANSYTIYYELIDPINRL